MERVFVLQAYGKQLWTRERAREVRTDLQKMLDDSGVGDVVVVDAHGVEVFDYSFANELFGKTVLSLPGEYPGRFFVVENLTTYTRENLAKAMESLSLAIIERKRKRPTLLGKVHPVDVETFDAVAAAKEPVSATHLSNKIGINLTAMNERLAKLTGMGLLRRQRGASPAGREVYQYCVLC
jgi:hypothetical protein